jgi:Flp pilus assembly protein TadB
MARSSMLRASDADRDAVAERLRQAAVEGRLEPWELEERLEIALRARTYGELDPLLRDLPRRTVTRSRGRPPVSAASAAGLAMLVVVKLVVLLLIVAAVAAAFAVTAAWWVLGLIVWLSLRSRRSCAGFHRPPRPRRVY